MSLIDFANSTAAKIILVAAGAWAGWTAQGWRIGKTISDMQRDQAQQRATAAEKKGEAESAVRSDLDTNVTDLQKANHHAKADRDNLLSGVRNGTVRVSIPVRSTTGISATGDSATAGGDRNEARAELDAATTEDLAAIAGDGDDGIRQLNSCIDSYNAVRERFNRLLKGEHVQAE